MQFKDLYIGQSYSETRIFTHEEIAVFSQLSHDTNPLHTDPEYAQKSLFGQTIVPGFLTASLFSAIIGTQMPGNGTIYLNQNLSFVRPVYPMQEVVATVTVKELYSEKRRALLETLCTDRDGNRLIEGSALVKIGS